MSLGNDLASIRKKIGLTLEEVQSSIKIPLYTLESIEDNSIFDSTEHNAAYIRNFIRSYARALKINDQDIVNALDEVQGGIYAGSLIPSTEERAVNDIEKSQKAANEVPPPFSLSNVSPPDIEVAPVKEKPSVESVNWADVGKRFANEEPSSKSWLIGIIIFVVIVLFASLFFFRNEIMGMFSSSSSEPIEASSGISNEDPLAFIPSTTIEDENQDADTVAIPSITSPIVANRNPIGEGLTVAVYAAFDILDPVRVTSDLNWRTNPFWMEQGQAFNFDFNDTLLVRGQYTKMLLLHNGHVIENARSRYFNSEYNSILITRSILDDARYASSPPSDFPYEVGAPDSIVYVLSPN